MTMDHYIDLRVRPDPEFSHPILMGALFSKLHRALVSLRADDIGVSFPGYSLRPRTLGAVLRLHATAKRLDELLYMDWLIGMRDHVSAGSVMPVPSGVKYRIVRRVQPKTNVDRLRRRHARRHEIPLELAAERIPDSVVQPVRLPFVNIRSLSTGQTFSIFIAIGELQDRPVPGEFSCYGLSTTATVPWF